VAFPNILASLVLKNLFTLLACLIALLVVAKALAYFAAFAALRAITTYLPPIKVSASPIPEIAIQPKLSKDGSFLNF
jgi:hypothetical protein